MAILLLSASMLTAGNSVFSFEGLPCQFYGNDIYGISMGNTGISDVFRKNTGFGNPAILATTNRTLFSTGLMFGWTGYQSRDGVKRSYRDNSLDFPYFSIAVPVNQHHFGFQFNSFASGVVQCQNTFSWTDESVAPADTLEITELQKVDQYIYRADLMYAIHFPHLNLGAGLNYYIGHDIRRFSQNADYGIFNTNEKLESGFKNPSATAGATLDYKNAALGVYYSLGCTLEGNATRTSIHETEDMGEVKFSVPGQLSAGLTYKLADEHRVAADYLVSFWKNAEYGDYENNGWKAGLGYANEPREGSHKTFFGRLAKRAGLSYRLLPFEANGKAVTETAVSTGFSIPLKNSENRLDLGIQYLWRGNLDDNSLQDRSVMFLVGITGYDIFSKAFNRSAPREIPEAEETGE